MRSTLDRTGALRALRAFGALAAIALLTAATCGRPVSVESEAVGDVTPTTYQIRVANRTAADLVVYYQAGERQTGERPIRLGLVRADASERFFVTALPGEVIRLTAQDPEGDADPIERQVTPVEDEVVEVTL